MAKERDIIWFRLSIVGILFLVFGGILVARLFFLQVIEYENYKNLAYEQHFEHIELPARRGDIYFSNYASNDTSKVATNITLDLLYVDPIWIDDQERAAQELTRIVQKVFCGQTINIALEEEPCDVRLIRFLADTPHEPTDVERADFRKKTPEEIQALVYAKIKSMITQKEVTRSYIGTIDDAGKLEPFKKLDLGGVTVSGNSIFVDPTKVPTDEDSKARYVDTLHAATLVPAEVIAAKLTRKPLRYVKIVDRLDPDISEDIRTKALKGVVLLPEHWRYYPEGDLGSQVIGFLDEENIGRYGIEEAFDTDLRGDPGRIDAESDPFGRQITVRNSRIVRPKDGKSIVLTIDRVVQAEVDKLLAHAVESYRAIRGQVIVMDPNNGNIIAMANYPSFNPNKFADVYGVKRTYSEPPKGVPTLIKTDKGFVEAMKDEKRNPGLEKYLYENKFGPGVYMNHTMMSIYEPGSIFKPLVMSSALDSGEVTPSTQYFDAGEIKVDEYVINNVSNACKGTHVMTNILNYSCNVGMSWIAKKMGRSLLYKYVTDYGFGERTDIDLAGEQKGRIEYYRYWSDVKLFNTAFGQGISVTPLQMAVSFSALANKGFLVRPRLIDKVISNDGQEQKIEPEIVRRVVSEKAALDTTAMLVSTIDKVTKTAKLDHWYVAGKTGTAQISSSAAVGYEEGEGSTNGSFAGFFPAKNPKFVIIVRIERPKSSPWADQTAAPLFKKIAEFMLGYYNIPKDR